MRQALARNSHPLVKGFSSPDPTFYPVDDDMGESLLHHDIAALLRILLQRHLTLGGQHALVGANQFIYFVEGDPNACVCPDVYVLPGVPLDTPVDCWKVWETGVVPSFAVEVVSKSVTKDYDEAIRRYAQLGVPEVVIFDPSPRVGRGSSRRVRFQIFRRIKGRGLVRVEATNEDRIKTKVPGCWLRMVGNKQALRLRPATGKLGETLVPTDAEAAEARAAAAEARAAAEAEARATAEAERAAEAEAEIARLRRALEEKTGKKPRSRG